MSQLNSKHKIIFILFLSLPFVDLITSLTTRFGEFPITIGILVRGLSLALSVIYVFFYSKCKYKKHTIIYIVAICVFAALYFLTKPDIWQISSLFTEIIAAFKYLYFPIMLLCLYNIFHDFGIDANMIKRIMLINVLVYSAMMLIPYFTGTGFPSYKWTFGGTVGWFYAANEIGPILIVLSICMLNLMDNDKKWKVLLAFPIIYSVSIIGTKVSLLGIVASVLIVCLIFVLTHKTNRFLLPIALIAILVISCLSSVAFKNIDTLFGMNILPPSVETVPGDSVADSDFPIDMVPQSTIDIIEGNPVLYVANQLTSNRILYFMENWKPYIGSGITTILFGFGWAPRDLIDNMYYKTLVEIDILDILLHYGIVGFCIYFAPFVFLLYKYFHKIKKNTNRILCLYISSITWSRYFLYCWTYFRSTCGIHIPYPITLISNPAN